MLSYASFGQLENRHRWSLVVATGGSNPLAPTKIQPDFGASGFLSRVRSCFYPLSQQSCRLSGRALDNAKLVVLSRVA